MGGMNYMWMLFSLVFGVLATLFRGWRWKLALEPLGERPRTANCVYAIFLSYASSLIIPRVGEVTRCGVLAKNDNVSFSKALGTVVSERMVDTLCVFFLSGLVLMLQLPVFLDFFAETGTNVPRYINVFTSGYFYLIILCILAIFILLFYLVRNVAIFAKIKGILMNVWCGIVALKDIQQKPLYILYTLGIWMSYFLEFYIAFFAFQLEKQIITLSEEMAPRLLGCLVGLLILWFGNAAPKLPFNRYTGLRLPWTIQDEGAWLVAHRTLGYLSLPTALFCFAGTAVRLPMEQWIKIWFMGPLLVWIGIPAALSWLYFRKKWK